MKSTIKLVVEAYYNSRNDVKVSVDNNGIIDINLPDPAGDPDMNLGYAFGPVGCKEAVSNYYANLQEAIDLIDFEIAVAPDIRRDISLTLGYTV